MPDTHNQNIVELLPIFCSLATKEYLRGKLGLFTINDLVQDGLCYLLERFQNKPADKALLVHSFKFHLKSLRRAMGRELKHPLPKTVRLTGDIAAKPPEPPPPPYPNILEVLKVCTPRDKTVIELLQSGKTQEQVGEELCITKQRINQILKQIGVKFNNTKGNKWITK